MDGALYPLPELEEAAMEQLAQRIAQLEHQLQQQQLRQQQPQPPRRPLAKYPKYFNEEAKDGGWLLWRSQFLEAAGINQDDDVLARRQAKLQMSMAAGTLVYDLQPEDFPNLQAFLDALESRFIPEAEANLAKVSFEKAVQTTGETIQAFHGRLRMLYRRAYPRSPGEEPLVRRFVVGLRDPKVQEQVIRKDPRTYFAALQAAQNELAVAKQVSHYQVGAPMSQDLGPAPMEIGSLQSQSNKAIKTASTKVIRKDAVSKNAREYPPCPVDGKTNHPIERCYLLRKMKELYLDQGKAGQKPATSSATGRSKTQITSKPTPSGNRRRRLMALLDEMEPEDPLENEQEDVDIEQEVENEILEQEDDDAELHSLLSN